MDADTRAIAFSRCRHAGNLHGMVELVDPRRDLFDKEASSLGKG